MAENNKTKDTKEVNKAEKKPNFFVRMWKKICKFCKDVTGEMRKVTWTSKTELLKSTKIVLVTVVAVAAVIAVIDTLFSLGINSIAGLIG
ncbi:MAG: preprotein translocase subunit SecE [Clostridia bacterium]|nr:preprotein translocase subunit SecE [Clostridia bacterium]